MDQVTADLIKGIIDLDCTITRRLRDGKGGFCFLGGLLAAMDPDWAVTGEGLPGGFVGPLIVEAFGLGDLRIEDAPRINDSERCRRRPARVAALKRFIDENTEGRGE
jgi:hypothetical protein